MESGVESNDLLGFVSSLRGGDGLRVEETLGEGYVRLRVSEAERRQAKHDVRCVEDAVIELLRNSRDAQASRIFVGTAREGDLRTIVVADDGVGIPPEMHARVFDARVTSKLDTMRMDRWGVHGRGMALYSIRENALSAEVMRSDVGCGCALRVVFDVSKLPERADQSTWPQVTGDTSGYTIRGPHNIYRTCVEFALEEHGTCNVYVGSPSEVLATMRVRCQQLAGPASGSTEFSDRPVCGLPVGAQDARQLAGIAKELGIELSERNAHRVIKGQIAPLVNVATRVLGTRPQPKHDALDHSVRKLSITPHDEEELQQALAEAFASIEQRYYVRLVSEPKVRLGRGRMTVVYEYVEDD